MIIYYIVMIVCYLFRKDSRRAIAQSGLTLEESPHEVSEDSSPSSPSPEKFALFGVSGLGILGFRI